MSVEVFLEGFEDLSVVVFEHPPYLLELPFSPFEGFGFSCCEGFEDCFVGVVEVCFGSERHGMFQ